MQKTSPQTSTVNFLDIGHLRRIRQKAMRQGVWFKALSRIDRVLFDLTIQVQTTIRSPTLARSILAVTRKIEEVIESKFARAIREIGVPTLAKLSLLAQKWGHTHAWQWTNDLEFARFLTVMKVNG